MSVCFKAINRDRLTLHVDAPFFRVESESFQCALLAESLGCINPFISSVVSGAGVSLGIFIYTHVNGAAMREVGQELTLHHTPQRIENGL